MRNYIIINGKASYEIPGLTICALPPITKPPKKIETLSVPGADGDIVTSIGGYEAYERKFSVAVNKILGDIDEIIPYLEQGGAWVFSNESDKIYDVRQTARIDFANLTRYRKADVVVTVQPIKRSALPAVTYSEFNWGGLNNSMRIVNAGNTWSRPSYTFHFSAVAGDIVFRTNGYKITFAVTGRVPAGDLPLDSMTITLDTLTGNAIGTLVSDGVPIRSGYLTDLVDVEEIGAGTLDITALQLPVGESYLTFVPGESSGAVDSVTVTDASSYI